MYKHYTFNIDPKSVYVIGDLHGYWRLLEYKIKNSDISDSVIIVAGDCGFGFEKPAFYEQTYNKIKRTLYKQNITIIFVRGNHDDPEYFDGEKINWEKFIAVPDYSVLTFDLNNKSNILCVGGAISVDRLWRIQKELKSDNRLYWNDEIPVYKPEILDNIKEDEVLIDAIVTHTSPSFAPLKDKSFIVYDRSLVEDISYERLTMTQIYDHIIKDKHPLKIWIYAHFHQHCLSYSEEDVKFIMLDCVGTHNNSWDIYQINR